jgi:Ferritin-like domain
MKSFGLINFALIGSAFASPVNKRQAVTDAGILNYALTLEHLEDKFYREGLANFTEADFNKAGYSSKFYNNIKEVSYDETTHVSFLTSALKGSFTPFQFQFRTLLIFSQPLVLLLLPNVHMPSVSLP